MREVSGLGEFIKYYNQNSFLLHGMIKLSTKVKQEMTNKNIFKNSA